MKKLKRILSIVIAALMIFSAVVIAGAETTGENDLNNNYGNPEKAYNIVFLIDGSSSMKVTDRSSLRYDAIDVFLMLMANTGNRVGVVIFDHTILASKDMVNITSINEKKALSDFIRSNSPTDGDTDIGLGLKTAAQMLNDQKDANMESLIIFLSDGATDLDTEEALNNSKKYKSEAISLANENGYPVYGVSLNVSSSIELASEVSDICKQTNGEYKEVKKASDISSVFDMFYALIYGESLGATSNYTGSFSHDFNVASYGIEAANIVINFTSPLESIELKKPDGTIMTQKDLADLMMSGSTYVAIKLPKPMAGKWTLTVKSKEKAEMSVKMVNNTTISVNSAFEKPEGTEYVLKDEIKILTTILDNGQPLADPQMYSNYLCTLSVVNGNSNKEETISAVYENGVYSATFIPTDFGTYYLKAIVAGEGMNYVGNDLSVNIGNNPPVAVANLNVSLSGYPFTKDFVINLNNYVVDKEDDVLRINILKSDFADATLNDATGEYSIHIEDSNSHTIEFVATDTSGATCVVSLNVKTNNILALIIIIVSIILLLIVLVIVILIVKKNTTRFNGNVSVSTFDNNSGEFSQAYMLQKAAGVAKLSSFVYGNTYGVSGKSTFQATGKDTVIFKSNKPFYSSLNPIKKVKKVSVPQNVEVTVSSVADLSNGIQITFTNNLFGF